MTPLAAFQETLRTKKWRDPLQAVPHGTGSPYFVFFKTPSYYLALNPQDRSPGLRVEEETCLTAMPLGPPGRWNIRAGERTLLPCEVPPLRSVIWDPLQPKSSSCRPLGTGADMMCWGVRIKFFPVGWKGSKKIKSPFGMFWKSMTTMHIDNALQKVTGWSQLLC